MAAYELRSPRTSMCTAVQINAAFLLLLISELAWPQSGPPILSAPVYSTTDVNHVNLVSGLLQFTLPDVSIGSAGSLLTHAVHTNDNGSFDAFATLDLYVGRIDPYSPIAAQCPTVGNQELQVTYASETDILCGTGGTYTSIMGRGSTVVDHGGGAYTYTRRDGSLVQFAVVAGGGSVPITLTSPDGHIMAFTYRSVSFPVGSATSTIYRLQSITRNNGLQLKYSYVLNSTPTSANYQSWMTASGVVALNNTVDYCDPTADSCSYSVPWPAAAYSWVPSGANRVFNITDMGGQAVSFTIGIIPFSSGINSGILSYTSATGNVTTPTYCYTTVPCMNFFGGTRNAAIWKLARDGQTWVYSTSIGSSSQNVFTQYGYTDPAGGGASVTHESNVPGPLLSYQDGKSGRTIGFNPAVAANYPVNMTTVDGDRTTYTFDTRGNLAQTVRTPASGSTLAAITQAANYDAICSAPLTCNRPNWIVDGNGNRTDYLYSTSNGGVLSVTMPADANGVRPQTRYTYVQRYSWYKNAAGSVVQASSPVWVLNSESYCRTSTANSIATGNPAATGCSAANDEVVTTYDYGPTSGANNLFLRGELVAADGQNHRTCYGYDRYGNRISETSANAGLASCP